MAQEWKWKERRIAWCADKGEPSERLATHHTAAVVDPERWEALINPDSTRWNSAAQSRRCLHVCKCAYGQNQQQHRQQSRRPPPPCFEFDTVDPGREVWLMGPSYGKLEGCWKHGGRWVWSKTSLIKKKTNKKLIVCIIVHNWLVYLT